MRFVIVTGMSGAGKSVTLNYLEDAGYFCVDNLPIQLIRPFARIAADGRTAEFTKIAVGLDVRSGLRGEDIRSALDSLRQDGISYEILFLDASDEVLLKRYKETRRLHPLSGKSENLEEAIRLERELLKVLRDASDHILDTSSLLTRELKSELIRVFAEGQDYRDLYVSIQSFGFKYGIPADSDLVMDVRFLPNPYYVEGLRELTGNDPPIVEYVMKYDESTEFIRRYTELLKFLIPHYIEEGKNQLVVSVGCTGGKHRSVAMTNALAEEIRKIAGCGVRVSHRDIEKDR